MRIKAIALVLLLALGGGAKAQNPSYLAWADTLAALTGFTVQGGNTLTYTKNGEEFLSSLLEDIAQARESINLEFYWFATDKVGRQVRDALIRKAREGVKVRVLLDNMVTPSAPKLFYDKMVQAGGEVRYANDFERLNFGKSFSNVFCFRDHRKIAVIDHCITYTGGINFCAPAIHDWDDLEFRVVGPVAVEMERLFAREWERTGGTPFLIPEAGAGEGSLLMQVIPGNASAQIADIYANVVRHAREYIYIQTPYYVPPPQLQEAILDAGRRGVDVRIVLAKSDHDFMDEAARDYYAGLVEAGVRLSRRQDKFDHAKTFVADGEILSCGTQNLDKRSFFLNLENSLFVYDPALAEEFTALFLDIEAISTPMSAADGEARGLRKLWRGFLRLISPLL